MTNAAPARACAYAFPPLTYSQPKARNTFPGNPFSSLFPGQVWVVPSESSEPFWKLYQYYTTVLKQQYAGESVSVDG